MTMQLENESFFQRAINYQIVIAVYKK